MGRNTKINSRRYDAFGNITFDYFTGSVPTGPGYAASCILLKTDASAGIAASRMYINIGTATTANFTYLGVASPFVFSVPLQETTALDTWILYANTPMVIETVVEAHTVLAGAGATLDVKKTAAGSVGAGAPPSGGTSIFSAAFNLVTGPAVNTPLIKTPTGSTGNLITGDRLGLVFTGTFAASGYRGFIQFRGYRA